MSEQLTYPVKCKMSIQSDRTETFFEVSRTLLIQAQEIRTKTEEEIEAFLDQFTYDSEISYLMGGVVYDYWNVKGDHNPEKRTDFVKKLDKKGWVKIEGEEQTWWIGTKEHN